MAQSTVAALAERNESPDITQHASKHIKLLQNFVDGWVSILDLYQTMHALAFKQRSGSEQQSGGIFLFSKICSKEHTFSLREVFIV